MIPQDFPPCYYSSMVRPVRRAVLAGDSGCPTVNTHSPPCRLGLTLHPAKAQSVDLQRGKESFVFLGCTIRKRRSIQRNPRWHFMQRWPSPKATKKLRARIREITNKRQSGKDAKQHRQMVFLAAATGLRANELLPLKWGTSVLTRSKSLLIVELCTRLSET
jgi:hypothetical protein